MSTMITDRDNFIIKDYFEVFKCATIQQLEKIYFKNQRYSYNICRQRLLRLTHAKHIKAYRDLDTNSNVYVYNEKGVKVPSLHRIILMDVYAECRYCGFNVEKFEVEKMWCGGKFRSDGFLQFTVDNLGNGKGRRYHYFIEVQMSNNTHDLEKYDKLYKTGEVQEYIGKDIFPYVLLVTDRDFKDVELEHTSFLKINTKLDKFPSILI